ncbi:MAG: FAD:protein FMN transferase [Actinomycetota bacterium]|nr:FAD:protein FMN transferase [Actinomycetota bacterium]
MTAVASRAALGTTATMCVTDADALTDAWAVLELELDAIDRACSRFRDDSELARLNADAGRWSGVSDLLLLALETALGAAADTDGLVDPTIGRTLRLAGYDRPLPLVLARDGERFRASFAPVPGWNLVELDPPQRRVRIPKGIELDLGATAKALAADRAAAVAHELTGTGVLVSLGGDVSVTGPVPDAGWPVRVADDHAARLDEGGPVFAVAAGGLATSGTTVRRWKAGNVTLHHIIDPRTGRPADTPWRTVTVAAGTCVEANVASTAAIVLGDGAPAWLVARGLPARLVAADGSVRAVAAWPEEAAA